MKSATSDTANTLPVNAKPLQLTPAERSALRARAHVLNPVVMVGNAGLTDSVLLEAHRALLSHELIKIRLLGGERDERRSISDTFCERLGAAPVQQIGKVLVIYRPR